MYIIKFRLIFSYYLFFVRQNLFINMKCTIPEISWHNRDPVLSVDVQRNNSKPECYRVATGGTDTHVIVRYIFLNIHEYMF